MPKTKEETVVLEDEDLEVIKDAIMPDVKEAIKESNKDIEEKLSGIHESLTKQEEERKEAEAKAAADNKKTTQGKGDAKESGIFYKEKELSADDPLVKGIEAGHFAEKDLKDSKELRFLKAARALAEDNREDLKKYNQLALALREKAGYNNEGTDSEGGALVPDPEFDTTIYENLPKYGIAFNFADVRQTDRTTVRVLNLTAGVEFYATNEAEAKTSAKLAFTKELTDLQKYAVIVPSTDELTDDAAIDFWALVTRELSRAYAKKADEIVFTDATYGITNLSGVLTHAVSGAGTTLDWDDLITAEGKPEDDFDSSGAAWYMRRETWFNLVQTKADQGGGAGTGQYFFNPTPKNPTTPWGTAVRFTRVLPKDTEVSSNDAFAVYGDLSNYMLYQKRGMQLKILTEATIVDTDDANFNLATQDGTAMRAVIRLLGVLPTGIRTKFVVVGTGTVS